MDERLQRALDGELAFDALTPEERKDLQRWRAMFGATIAPVRHLPPIDIAPEVMRRLQPETGPIRRALRAVAGWLWAPRAVTLRPAYAMAGALALAAVVWISATDPAPVQTASQERIMVQFRLGDAAAREVSLVGDFNDWRPGHRMHEIAAGVWAVDVALEPGVYNYVFVVDGEAWRLDPLAPRVTDGFGGASSRVAVLSPDARS